MRAHTRICARNPDDFVPGRKPIDFVSQSISQASGNPHDGPKNSYGAFWGEFGPSQDKLSFSFFLSRHGPVFRIASRNPAVLVFRNPADLASARESERTPSVARKSRKRENTRPGRRKAMVMPLWKPLGRHGFFPARNRDDFAFRAHMRSEGFRFSDIPEISPPGPKTRIRDSRMSLPLARAHA